MVMKFEYSFPSIKGLQAGSEYYISMVPLNLLAKLFPAEEDFVAPEFRAQRKINEVRIPEIKNYIIRNRNSYVFSALAASINGRFSFVSVDENEDIGILKIDMDSVFLINDGQHRKAAIEAALKEDSSLGTETIPIVFFRDDGLSRSQQIFTDLNKHAVRTSNSLANLYDSRDIIASVTRTIIAKVPFFTRFIDKERDILGKNSSKIFTLNNLYKANQRLIHSDNFKEEDTTFLIEYWTLLANSIREWNDLLQHNLSKKSLREDYIISLAVTLNAFGRLGRVFMDNPDLPMKEILPKLCNIDWSRTNTNWRNRTIRDDGKVMSSDEAVILTCSKIKELLELPLSPEERVKEAMVR